MALRFVQTFLLRLHLSLQVSSIFSRQSQVWEAWTVPDGPSDKLLIGIYEFLGYLWLASNPFEVWACVPVAAKLLNIYLILMAGKKSNQ